MVTRLPMLARRCRAFALAGALGVAFAACSPNLENGVYGCKTGACPDGFYCHFKDKRCYEEGHPGPGGGSDADAETGADAGANAGGTGGAKGDAGGDAGMNAADADAGDASSMPDTGTPDVDAGVPYDPCTTSATCGDGLSCRFGPDTTATNGYCSKGCATQFDCPALGMRPGLCLEGECFPGCTGPSDCGGGYGCYAVATGPMQGVNVCLEITDSDLAGNTACQVSGMPPMPLNCDTPAICLFHGMFDPDNGVCSLHCELGGGPATTECPGGGRCVEAFEGVGQCLKPCTSQADCVGLTCAPWGPGSNLCIPAGWTDETPPLPLPMPPGM